MCLPDFIHYCMLCSQMERKAEKIAWLNSFSFFFFWKSNSHSLRLFIWQCEVKHLHYQICKYLWKCWVIWIENDYDSCISKTCTTARLWPKMFKLGMFYKYQILLKWKHYSVINPTLVNLVKWPSVVNSLYPQPLLRRGTSQKLCNTELLRTFSPLNLLGLFGTLFVCPGSVNHALCDRLENKNQKDGRDRMR